jgi:hypothetical protein
VRVGVVRILFHFATRQKHLSAALLQIEKKTRARGQR